MMSENVRFKEHIPPIICLLILPVLANGMVFLGLIDANPAGQVSGFGQTTPSFLPGGFPDWLDYSTGAILQPLAALSIQDWLNGVVPWWNPYTGAGMPLAAEMVGFAFFLPFLFLFKCHSGFILMRAAMQALSGISMYALLCGLNCRMAAAFTGAVLFGLNATFFFSPQVIGTFPFLPLLLLGIEAAAKTARGGKSWVAGLIAIALAYSVYGGFPEVAFFDGLLAAVWIGWRFFTTGGARWKFLALVTVQSLIGVCLALPLLGPFLTYANRSYLGSHVLAVYGQMTTPADVAPMILFPFIFGPFGELIDGEHFSRFSGIFGFPAVILAIFALVRRSRHRGLTIVLASFVCLWLARCWGFRPALSLINSLPFMAKTDSSHFIWPALEAAIFILAALAMDGWMTAGRYPRDRVVQAVIIMIGILAVCMLPNARILASWFSHGQNILVNFSVLMTLETSCAGMIVLLFLAREPGKSTIRIMMTAVAMDALLTSFMPQLSAPRSVSLDLAGVNYLQKHQALERIFSIGIFNFEIPSQYKLAALSYFELPVDQGWANYVVHRLDPYVKPAMFGSDNQRAPHQTEIALMDNLPAFEATGVNDVVTRGDADPFSYEAVLPTRDPHIAGISLDAGMSFNGTIPADLIDLKNISSVEVSVGTDFNNASGPLKIAFCDGSVCTSGSSDLTSEIDNDYFSIPLDNPLPIKPGDILHYQIFHPSGRSVGIWLASFDGVPPSGLTLQGHQPSLVPLLEFQQSARLGDHLVFRDKEMSIYALPKPRPYFTTDVNCALSEMTWNKVVAVCPAPAKLLRLEAWYPGWHARVNGREIIPAESEEIFQSIPLPAGRTLVKFYYIPDHMKLFVGLAISAFLAWLLLLRRSNRLWW